MRLRHKDGRLLGDGIIHSFYESDEFWEDKKCYDVRFPQHDQMKASPVHTYHISELNKHNNK